MTGNILSTAAEQGSILDRIEEEARRKERRAMEPLFEAARQEGRQKGRQEGRQEGQREALLDIARARCDEQTARELAELEDLETLRQRGCGISPGGSASRSRPGRAAATR